MERLFYGYNYSVISAVALGVHLIINWKHLFGWRRDKSRGGEREFSVFLAAISAFFLCDIAWGVLAGQKLIFALYVNTVLFFILLASSFPDMTRPTMVPTITRPKNI